MKWVMFPAMCLFLSDARGCREFLKVRAGGAMQVVDGRTAQTEGDEGRARQGQEDRSQGQACPQASVHLRWER
ncbi:hypothetical protein GCM10008955_31080 [Deinococcus malanensis]|uniref:Secreted protein n=1 Tax=Deinococcus malanensis TaxID=1706855 RepID=A0ABQ2F2Q5_9DEIO|nr:hypothetical protein GCM10008955_31080 [Deinococcus malanensis]